MPIRALLLTVLLASPLAAQDSIPVTEARTPRVTAGVTTGTMGFADRRVQQGVTAVVRYHFAHSMSVALSPAFARIAFPSSLGGGAVSGLTDLPVELSADHSFGIPWSPTPGISLGASIPVGNRQAGFGTGGVGATIGAGLGLSPLDAFSLHAGVGKSLDDYSLSSSLGASSSTWGDLEMSYQLLEHIEATAGVNGDVASSDSLGSSRAIALSLAMNVHGPYTVTLSGGHGISGAAARWTFAVGFGTDFAGIQSLGSSSPIQRFMRSLGGGSHRGSGSTSSGHGRGG
jgi:hypothetical protein